MKKYELFTIIKPNLDNDEADKIVAKVEETVKTLGGNVENSERMGRKKLAYEIGGFTDGFMVNQTMTLPQDKVADLKRQLRLNEAIIRVMFTTKEIA